jgi:signal transduction histidine kinase/CheY-like chemotaxis protein
MSVLSFLTGKLPSIRLRLLASFCVLAVSTLIVGIVAWYWLTRSNDILEDLHHTTLLEVTRSHDLTEQSSNLTTSAPFLLNLKSPYLVESEGSELLGSIDSAILLWTDNLPGNGVDGAPAEQIVNTLNSMRGSVVRLIESIRRLATHEDQVRKLAQQLTSIEQRLALMIDPALAAPDRDGVRQAQLATNLLIMASAADSFISIGEFRRRFYLLAGGVRDQVQPAVLANTLNDLMTLADSENGLFRTRYSALRSKLASHQALSAIRSDAGKLNALISDYVGAAELEISRRREQTSSYLAYAKVLVVASGLASIFLALVSAHYVSRYVTGNINSIATAMTGLAGGDHSHQLPRRSRHNDEIGKLLDAFRVFRANAIRLGRSNRQLHRKTALFESIFSNINDGIAITGADGKLIEHNRRLDILLRFFGGATDIAIGCLLDQVLARHLSSADEAINVGYESDDGFRELRNKLGEVLEVRTSALPDGGKIWLFSDTTERTRVEETLRRFQRLESLGQLTGEVAHDFNNILSAIATTLPAIDAQNRDTAAYDTALNNIGDALDIGSSLTQRLLAFARKQQLEPEIVELNELVLGVRELISISLGDGVELSVSTYRENLYARVDPGQLESAMLNLCLNSAQAIDGEGRISVSVYPEADAYVCIKVEDDGCGMSPEVLERALEPFFSTRRGSRGSGLGLSIVYGFTRQSDGDLVISSTPGKGTTVIMKLRPEEVTEGAERILPAGTSRTIVLVEDNAATLQAATGMLQGLGHDIVAFGTADRARSYIEQNLPIDVLLTDLHLGHGQSGWDLARLCLAGSKDTRIIVTSGRTAELARVPEALEGKIAVLEKPYTSSKLRLLINDDVASNDPMKMLQGV